MSVSTSFACEIETYQCRSCIAVESNPYSPEWREGWATVLPVGAPDFCVAVADTGHVRFSCRLVSHCIPFPRNFYRDRPTKAKQNWSKNEKLVRRKPPFCIPKFREKAERKKQKRTGAALSCEQKTLWGAHIRETKNRLTFLHLDRNERLKLKSFLGISLWRKNIPKIYYIPGIRILFRVHERERRNIINKIIEFNLLWSYQKYKQKFLVSFSKTTFADQKLFCE